MQKLKYLTGNQKARLITLAVIVTYLLFCVLAYVWEVRMQTPQFEYVDSMQVDGAEAAPIANLFVAGANGLLGFLNMILSVVAMLVVALLLLVPWRCIAIRKNSVVTEIEWKVSKYLLIGFTVLSLVIGVIMLRFANLIFLLILAITPALVILLLAFLPMRSAYLWTRDSKDEEADDMQE